jgi:beta-mannosidase
MTDTFRMPKDFASLVYLSLILQAEGVRYGVEHWRRNMERVSGTLYWQLNDCWPVASWASIDYFGRWKALHYAARRFYAPLMLSIEESGTAMAVSVTSDLTELWEGSARWSLETLKGEQLQTGGHQVSATPLANTPICTFDFEQQVPDGIDRNTVFVCELWQGQERVALQVATFVPNKHLELVEPGLTAVVQLLGDQLVVSVTANALACFVELSLDGVDVVFSDNYFDLPAGRTMHVTCPLPTGRTLEWANTALQMRSLYDSFA